MPDTLYGETMPVLNVTVGRLELQNPVMPAAGTFGYGEEYASLIDLDRLGELLPGIGDPDVRPAFGPRAPAKHVPGPVRSGGRCGAEEVGASQSLPGSILGSLDGDGFVLAEAPGDARGGIEEDPQEARLGLPAQLEFGPALSLRYFRCGACNLGARGSIVPVGGLAHLHVDVHIGLR